MNFTRFPANTTNVFPIANSVTGGQLLTEFNLISRESVLTNGKVQYFIGPSYVHGSSDFTVRLQEDELGTAVSSTALEITPGRAVVNGHYLESVTNIVIDLAEANAELQSYDQAPLKGHLAVGLRAMYSTEQTLAASLKTVDGTNMLEGIQVVILPIGKIEHGYFVLPEDSPEDENYVTAHLKLAEFYFLNGSIRSITQNEAKIQYIPSSRIGDFGNLLSSTYVTRNGLNPKKLYTFAGKANDPNSLKDTWCDSTDSLFVWQKAADLKTTTDPQLKQAEFGIDSNEYVTLTLPHKNIDGGMYNTDGKEVFYNPRVMQLPKASFANNTPGTINSDYTRSIKAIKEALANFYHLPEGKQRGFLEEINTDEREELPTLNQQAWNIGDYILVLKDNSITAISSDMIQAPSSIYVVLPPLVTKVEFLETVKGSTALPSSLTGVELMRSVMTYAGDVTDSDEDVATYLSNLIEDQTVYNNDLGVESSKYHGEIGKDYICVKVEDVPTSGVLKDWYYYYKVSSTDGAKVYSDPIPLTGTISLATEDSIGGFLNVTDTDLDNGYVYRDENGHLRVLDYSLLRSGVLAYQLGQDYEFGNGLSSAEIQSELDEYVNNRVVFPNESQMSNATYPNMIEITLTLSEENDYSVITLENIDSRFGAGIYLHICGKANYFTTINIRNCEKIRIASIEGTPIINIYNSCVFYDADVIEYVLACDRTHNSEDYSASYAGLIYDSEFTGIENLTLWYQKFDNDDPNLIVDGMTVTETDTPIIPDDFDFWSDSVVNDSHFYYGLQSLTFAPNGTLAGCGLYMRNDMSANIDLTTSVAVAQFNLPQGSGFTYPLSSLTKPIKVTGSFITSYPFNDPEGYIVMQTNFTALTQTYGAYSSASGYSDIGTISFLTKSELVTNFIGVDSGTSIDGWEANSYHVFQGWTIS